MWDHPQVSLSHEYLEKLFKILAKAGDFTAAKDENNHSLNHFSLTYKILIFDLILLSEVFRNIQNGSADLSSSREKSKSGKLLFLFLIFGYYS